jgi:hypothetical protein
MVSKADRECGGCYGKVRPKDKLTIPIPVDTYKSEVAERSFEHGAEIINDPSGPTMEPQLRLRNSPRFRLCSPGKAPIGVAECGATAAPA